MLLSRSRRSTTPARQARPDRVTNLEKAKDLYKARLAEIKKPVLDKLNKNKKAAQKQGEHQGVASGDGGSRRLREDEQDP